MTYEDVGSWPEDVPAPAAPSDEQDEIEALGALWRERQRELGIEAPPAPSPSPWTPQNPLAARLWMALPADGRGVEYWRLARSVEASGWPMQHVQAGLCALVLIGRCYVAPGTHPGTSLVGRGTDPRVGAVGYRTGAVTL